MVFTLSMVLASPMFQSVPISESIVPKPVSMIATDGTCLIGNQLIVEGTPRNGSSPDLGAAIRPFLPARTGAPIRLKLDPSLKTLGDEGYRLSVKTSEVVITAPQPAGVFYGIQTLRQLIHKDFPAIPCMEIEDQPRFSWRGMHLDVARNFMPKAFILKFLDQLAFHKLNVFHWHLTDDQGWRIEIKKYPKLTEVGSKRKDTMLTYDPPTYVGKPAEGYYTQNDIREIVAYAKARFIRVMPEIEMPGHVQAAIAAYPQLGNSAKAPEVSVTYGVLNEILNVDDSTVRFMQDVLAEVIQLFPSQFIHIGGDEVPKTAWENSPRAQALMKQRGLKNEEELQSWFIHRMDRWLASRGRRMVGWDEILEGGLAPGATVMSWRGTAGGIAAARSGHDVIMTPTSHTYLDYYQSRDRDKEPHGIGGYLPLRQVYSFEPIPDALTATEAKRVLGSQGQLWTEYIRTPEHVEYMAWPRGCALAEVLWSPADARDYPDFRKRLDAHLKRLAAMKVNFRAPDADDTPPVARWKPGQFKEEWQNWVIDVTDRIQAGDFKVVFNYMGGMCRLDIAEVELMEDTNTVAIDVHDGRTGSVDVANVYRLTLPVKKPGVRYVLRAKVRPDGGTDSAGDVAFWPAG